MSRKSRKKNPLGPSSVFTSHSETRSMLPNYLKVFFVNPLSRRISLDLFPSNCIQKQNSRKCASRLCEGDVEKPGRRCQDGITLSQTENEERRGVPVPRDRIPKGFIGAELENSMSVSVLGSKEEGVGGAGMGRLLLKS